MANAKYRLTPLKERMGGYLETVGGSQVSFEGSFDEATKVANELLQSNTDFLEVEITKIGKTAMASKKVGKVTSEGVFKYGLGGALLFIGLAVAGVMAYKDSKNQAPENEYKIKLYKKGTLKDTLIFKESYVNKAFQDYSKLGYVVRVAKIKTMAEGGGVGSEVYIEFLNKEKGYKKDIKHFKSYAEAVKWGRENFDNFNSDMIHYKMAKGGGVVTYKNKYNTKYGYDKNESHSLEDIARDTKISTKGLQQIYDKGIGAYKTNPQSVRPNVKSKEQWAMARVYSAVMGGKASKVDENELKMVKGGRVTKIKEDDYFLTLEGYRRYPQLKRFRVRNINGNDVTIMYSTTKSYVTELWDKEDIDYLLEKGHIKKTNEKEYWKDKYENKNQYSKGGGVETNFNYSIGGL